MSRCPGVIRLRASESAAPSDRTEKGVFMLFGKKKAAF